MFVILIFFHYLPLTDLSECQLMQVPDAVYHLLRHTELQTCDLSGNVITKIPPKFTDNFSLITGKYLHYAFPNSSITHVFYNSRFESIA